MMYKTQSIEQKKMPGSVGAETSIKRNHSKVYHNIIVPQKREKSSINCKNYSTDIFNHVKNIVDIKQALEYYGVSINDKNFALCPFHQEKTPSFKIYDDSFYCFGCGENGTVIDFVMRYFGLTNIEAVKKLNDDFALNLTIRGTHGMAIRHSHRQNKSLVDGFIGWEKKAFIAVSSYFRALRFWGEQIFVNHIEYFELYLPEVENIVFVENMLDIMIDNTHNFFEQVKFYRTYRKAVADIERKFNY